jgi:alanine or glycine:cation symporter, AGCS family
MNVCIYPHLKTRLPNLEYAEQMPFWNTISSFTFGLPLFLLMLVLGLVFVFSIRGVPISKISKIFQFSFDKTRRTSSGSRLQISSLQAGMLSLCGTLGASGLLGVVTSLQLGGAGAVFWMWCFGLIILVFKHFETTLSVHWRRVYNDGSVFGGPMLYLARGLVDSNARVAGVIGGVLALLSLLVALTYGNVFPVSSAATFLNTTQHIPKSLVSLVLAVALLVVVAGGVARAARVAQIVFPIMIGLLVLPCLIVLVQNLGNIPKAFISVFSSAFGVHSLSGGAAGLVIQKVMAQGMARALLSTQAGMGSSSIAHAQAQTEHAARQGLWGILEGLICLVVTGFFALVVLSVPNALASSNQSSLTVLVNVFSSRGLLSTLMVLGISLDMALLAFCALIAWEFYAEESLAYLIGDGFRWALKLVFCGLVFLTPLFNFSSLTFVPSILIGLMVLVNVLGLLLLLPQVVNLTKGFFAGEAYLPPDLNNAVAPDIFEEFDFDLK